MTTSVRYRVERLTVDIDAAPAEFRARYEQAVPPLPEERMADLVRRHAPWAEMLAVVEEAAPFGFLIYNKIDADPLLRLAGDEAFCTSYLLGNHTIAERMFRYEPAVLLYAPLHTVIWGDPDGPAHFTFDKPSDQFGSFGNPAVTAVGTELDGKVAALLRHLGAEVPAALLGS